MTTDPQSLTAYFAETKIPLRLACNTISGWPLVLSLWYLFEDGILYCATPETAKVVSYLTADPRCAFEVAADAPPYCGVRGRAVASLDRTRGDEILERLLIRYLGGTKSKLAQKLLARSAHEMAIRLEPQNFYTWNFTKRMPQTTMAKVCPE